MSKKSLRIRSTPPPPPSLVVVSCCCDATRGALLLLLLLRLPSPLMLRGVGEAVKAAAAAAGRTGMAIRAYNGD